MAKPECQCDHCQGVVWPVPPMLSEVDQRSIQEQINEIADRIVRRRDELILEMLGIPNGRQEKLKVPGES